MKYRIRNWSEFQHYKDRNPPWIKLHFSLLSSEDWVVLDDASRTLAVACMLVASRSGGEIDVSRKGAAYIKRVAYLNSDPDFNPLIECGFLDPASDLQADASALQADARPETETETETETEKRERKTAPKGRRFSAQEVTDQWRQTAREMRPDLDVDETLAKFSDYWTAKTGQGATKRDWLATWRNWLRNEKRDLRSNGRLPHRDEDLPHWAASRGLPDARPGENWRAYRSRLEQAIQQGAGA